MQRCAELMVMPEAAASSARPRARRSPPKVSSMASAFCTELLNSGSRGRSGPSLRDGRFIACSIELSIIDSLRGEPREPAHPRVQCPGQAHRAVRLLIVLQYRDQRASDGESRAIQRVHRLGLAALGVAPTCLQAPCLESLEVAARGDLAIALLRRQPGLEVVGHRAAEADIAGAQRDAAEGN